MNSQERAQEPSMDEILASIRRIISEEPASGRQQPQTGTVAPLPANPLFKPVAQPAADKAAESEPAFGRLAEALRGSPQAPQSLVPAGGIDDDLADLLREPIAAPVAASTSSPAAPADDKSKETWAIWRSAPKPAEGGPSDRAAAAAAKAPQFIPPTPVKAPEVKANEQPAAAIDLGALVPRRDELRSAPASNGIGRAETKPPSFDAAFPPTTSGTSQKSAADAKPEPANSATPHAEPAKTSSGPVVIAAMPVVPPVQAAQAPVQAQPVETRVTEQDKKAAAAGEPGKIEASVPLPPRQIAIGPSASAQADDGAAAAGQANASDIAKTEAETSAAAASALGALAAGLAVASANAAAEPTAQIERGTATPPAGGVGRSVAGAASPVQAAQAAVAADTNSEPNAMPVPAAVQPATSAATGPVRTLEDAVADMLRPMLQQWLTDNMPRIVEKALKIETGHVSLAPAGDKSKP